MDLYLQSGVRVVWVAYPERRAIYAHRANSVVRLSEGQNLEEPEVLPGFSVPVAAFFEGL